MVSEDELETVVRRAVRAELRAAVRRFATLFAGVVVGVVVLPTLAAVFFPGLLEAGVPPVALGLGAVLLALGMIAYGWGLPPFRRRTV